MAANLGGHDSDGEGKSASSSNKVVKPKRPVRISEAEISRKEQQDIERAIKESMKDVSP